jgi:DNA-binding PadR family transcriptional regulator
LGDVRDEPLRPPVFHILLTLASGDLHGLGIAEEVERTTDGAVELGPGTLYRSLREMVGGGLIREVEPPEPDADPRRKYYRISATGRGLLARDAERLARVVELARARRVLPDRA